MARYDFRCDACNEDTEVESPMLELYEHWPNCPKCGETMRRVWVALRTIWKTSGSTGVKKGLPDVR